MNTPEKPESNEIPKLEPIPLAETVHCASCGEEMIQDYAIEYRGKYYCVDCCDDDEIPLCTDDCRGGGTDK